MNRNIETIRAIYDRFGAGDVPGILGFLAPDVEWEHDWHSSVLRWFAPRRGHQEVVGFFQSLAEFDFVRFEPQTFLAGGDMVAVPIQIELVYKANGKRIRDLEVHLFTFDAEGKVRRFRHVADTHQMVMATAS